MATVACPRFSQNAWRRELCANCFKAKTEHAVVTPRPAPSKHATPKQSILKRSTQRNNQTRTVCFPADESEVIGYDGGDISDDDEPDCEVPLSNGDSNEEPLYPEMSEEEDKDLQNITRRNTDFNSENANLLIDKSPPPVPKPIKRVENNKSTTPITINCTPFSASNNINNNKNKNNDTKTTIEIRKRNGSTPLVSVTPFGGTRIDVKAKNDVNSAVNVKTSVNNTTTAVKERNPAPPRPTERRPPLGHEASAPLTAPALVKLQATSPPTSPTPEPPPSQEIIFHSDSSSEEQSDSLEPMEFSIRKDTVELIEPIEFSVRKDSVEFICNNQPPAFLRHKDSVDLISPPQSPRLPGKTEERPVPIGKVSSTLTVTLKSPTSPTPSKEPKRAPKLVEARSSALIRRWTVGERVLIQPRRPVLDAPEIVPLALQPNKPNLGLEPRELAGQPDGEDSTTASETNTTNNISRNEHNEPSLKPREDKPPTPPSSPLPDEDLDKPPMLPNSPPPTLHANRSMLHDLATQERPTTLNITSHNVNMATHDKVIKKERSKSVQERVNLVTAAVSQNVQTATQEKSNTSHEKSNTSHEKVTLATKARSKSVQERTNLATQEVIKPQEKVVNMATQEKPKSITVTIKEKASVNMTSQDKPHHEKATAPIRPKSIHVTPQERAIDVAIVERPKSVDLASTPTYENVATSPSPVTPRSSFLHGAMLGRPQIPAKPASLLASVPAKAASLLANVTSKRFSHSNSSVKAVSTPQPPSLESQTKKTETSIKKEEIIPITPTTPPINSIESSIYDTPKNTTYDTPKPPFVTPKPKLGSYKKRQAPKPPVYENVEKTHVRSLSQDSFEEITRRDSITSIEKSPPCKKNNARFSLRRLLRLGKDERALSPESPSSPTSSPSPPGSPPIRPEIIHPSMLDGKEVQVVSRFLTTPPQNMSPTSSTATTPAGRPRPPPPPPRTLSLSGSVSGSRPSRPPPPQSAQLLEMREKASDAGDHNNEDDAVYANLDLVKSRAANIPSKPQRTPSMRETSPEPLSSPASDDTDYETIQFSEERMSRRRRSAVLGSLEENYGAVVGANHRALAQLVTSLRNLSLPANHNSTSLLSYATETNKEEERSLVLLQMLVALKNLQETGVMNTNLTEFVVLTFSDPQMTEIGPRIEHKEVPSNSQAEPLHEIALQTSHFLLSTDTKLHTILQSQGLNKAIAYLEFKIWGPELSPQDKEIGIQRWLDLERATALQNLAQRRNSIKLAISQELYLNFLVESSAIGLSQASLL